LDRQAAGAGGEVGTCRSKMQVLYGLEWLAKSGSIDITFSRSHLKIHHLETTSYLDDNRSFQILRIGSEIAKIASITWCKAPLVGRLVKYYVRSAICANSLTADY
jgi:hypothetical protein